MGMSGPRDAFVASRFSSERRAAGFPRSAADFPRLAARGTPRRSFKPIVICTSPWLAGGDRIGSLRDSRAAHCARERQPRFREIDSHKAPRPRHRLPSFAALSFAAILTASNPYSWRLRFPRLRQFRDERESSSEKSNDAKHSRYHSPDSSVISNVRGLCGRGLA